MNGWEGIPQASAQGNERKKSAKPTAVNEARPAYEVRFAISKPCKAVERPLCMIEIPCPRTDTLLTHRARGCRGDASPLRSSTRTFRIIRTRLRQAAPWQAVRSTRDGTRGQEKTPPFHRNKTDFCPVYFFSPENQTFVPGGRLEGTFPDTKIAVDRISESIPRRVITVTEPVPSTGFPVRGSMI